MLARSALPVLALAVALLAGGCARDEDEPVREGLFEEVGGVEYNVYITRQLNLKDPEDRDYYKGPEPPPGSTFYGVFVRACNPSKKETRMLSHLFKIVDTQGEEFRPVDLPDDNVFAYNSGPLAPRECLPADGSAAASSPIAGAMLLFELPLEAAENRPLELEIEAPEGTEGGHDHLAVELDI